MASPVDRVLMDIFERFDPSHVMHRLTSDAIGQVRQRGFLEFADLAPAYDTQPLSSKTHLTTTAPAMYTLGVTLQGSHQIEREPSTIPDSQMKRRTPPRAKPKRTRVYVKSERRRLQCLASQKRYIKKQADYRKGLEAAVAQLQEEVMTLSVHHSRLLSAENSSIWSMGFEYFQLFRNGISSSLSTALNKTSTPIEYPQEHVQLAFLRKFMANNVTTGVHGGD